MLKRRNLLAGLGIGLAAPAIIRMPGLLMPVRVLRPLTRREEAQLAMRKWSREMMTQAQFEAFSSLPLNVLQSFPAAFWRHPGA